ncbi:hypothetical protein AGNV_027 [Anticarsia gemmatalis multiple nucleopolyhedrovirus]|uniref:Uncharacterized protein n=1 Tax=Anticarsia gemmatalis multiple nucleopolyhedrovirus TaxID=268591 RepID=A0A0S3IVM5_9ABAC|nr:hypothetical protein AGNV_027 [Anticarsia gemmatalis nucleopolyhedrovirus]YP_009316044.1 hypothetical protein AGNV_027 [Anticarsia gemmatalis multiple nucleopolyhedrovirus]AKJ32596.1 hypothetical protein AGNV_027 [Anticarsia gemmatalis multiple nucleopolyhedrovirus]ALR69834.1 hypothetical protein AGNV_027 [Anticarsia gemmatalis multiple nucleopolyhedrovirus]ALR69992.1 hypothetical protein AGNV_027 [Anticarsia gemmatalis multiple nucleopolyhedrovirus]ALR70149.1 hypothetical protein AGNV_027 
MYFKNDSIVIFILRYKNARVELFNQSIAVPHKINTQNENAHSHCVLRRR